MSVYLSEEQLTLVCNEVSCGKGLGKVCKEHPELGVSSDTLRHWLFDSKVEHAKFRDDYALATRARVDWLVEQIEALQDECLKKIEDEPEGSRKVNAIVTFYNNKINDIKWLASKWGVAEYGDRLELAGDRKKPLVVNFGIPRPQIDCGERGVIEAKELLALPIVRKASVENAQEATCEAQE